MSRLIDWCVTHRFLVIFATLLIGAIGVRAAQRLPIDAVPDVTNVQVQVLTNAPTLGALEVERHITAPLEALMSGLPRLTQTRSSSRFGLSALTLVFEEGTDLYFARQLISERLVQARGLIPEALGTPALGPLSSGLGEIYQFEVRGEPMCAPEGPDTPQCYTLMELRTVLDWHIALQLRDIPGVVEINPFGGELKTYEVRVDPGRLAAFGLSLSEVFEALEENNVSAGGGYIVGHGEQRVVRGEGLLQSLDDIAQVRVTTRADGSPVVIGDVARVMFAPMVRQGAVTRDARGEVVTASVMMLLGANAGEVAAAVSARLDALAPTLPPGVKIETYYNRAELVDRTIRTVATNLIEGAVLVIVVLLLLLGDLRGGLLIAALIPLSLLITFIVMRALGLSGDLMSLGALDFGLIIDGGVVIIERITRRLSASQARGDAVQREVRAATRDVIRPVLFGTLIIMIVYLPILTLRGVEGALFRPMAITVLAALAAALCLALTMIPAASSWVYRAGVSEHEPWLARMAQRGYEPLLRLALRYRGAVITLAIGALIAGGVIAATLGAEFIPRLDEGAIAMQAIRPASVSLEESIASTGRIEATLTEAFKDEIATVISRTGRAEIATDPMGVELSDIYIMLHPKSQWTRAPDKEALIQVMEATLRREVPGQNYTFSQPIELRTSELLSGARSDVVISIYGPDLAELERAGERIVRAVSALEGAADVSADQVSGAPTLRISVDRRAAARFGISAAQALDAVSAIGGRVVGTIFEGQQRFALQVRLSEEARATPELLNTLLIAAPGGKRVPLGQVATLTPDEGPALISRDRAQRRLMVQLNVRGRDLAGFVAQAQARVSEQVQLPPGYVVSWGGQLEHLRAARARLAIAVPVALMMIMMLLYTTFGAARPALIIALNIPMAAVGGVLALWARGMPLSLSAAVGFIALSGIAVLNGVVLVSSVRDLQREGHTLREATELGARQRLRAVLMTALTDGIGFLPMALSQSAGAQVQQPLATVVIGGLITSTLLTLLVLPAIYSALGGSVDHEPQGAA